jgi:hypothetical protein
MIANSLDLKLTAAYQEFDVPVDRFLADPALTKGFLELVAAKTGNGDLDVSEVMHRLITLRKRGQLPRLRRAYKGRNGSRS